MMSVDFSQIMNIILAIFAFGNINHRHFDVSPDERIRETANPAHDAGPSMHG